MVDDDVLPVDVEVAVVVAGLVAWTCSPATALVAEGVYEVDVKEH
jgi:hypothetical protein